MADEVLHRACAAITDLMVMPGLINLDFADVRTVMSEMGKAMMGTGEADGEDRALDAAENGHLQPAARRASHEGRQGRADQHHRRPRHDACWRSTRRPTASATRSIPTPTSSSARPSTTIMGGKIRVSVVATGIDAEVGAQPAPGKVFSFPARTATAHPAPIKPVAEPIAETDTAPMSIEPTAGDGDDELLLGADDILTSPVGTPPIAPPTDEDEIGRSGQWRRHVVRAHVQHRSRRSEGADRRRCAGRPRPDRHPALSQPPEQPIGPRGLAKRAAHLGRPFSFG